jgi:hypothetical protein
MRIKFVAVNKNDKLHKRASVSRVYSHCVVIQFAAHPPSKLWPKGILACSHAEWAVSRALVMRAYPNCNLDRLSEVSFEFDQAGTIVRLRCLGMNAVDHDLLSHAEEFNAPSLAASGHPKIVATPCGPLDTQMIKGTRGDTGVATTALWFTACNRPSFRYLDNIRHGRALHVFAPLLGFFGDELGEVGGREREHLATEIGKPRLAASSSASSHGASDI